ncbi:MAG: N-acetylmuramoyl-L-alanine amidase, partial [Firmicutes bacterium]|nr:N-acetylmuramoyl-L-alanine amidase [Bacillota bacterium]
YRYHIYNYQTKTWSMVQDYSTNASLKWTFNELGNFQVMCFVKDVNSVKEYDAAAYCETTVNVQPVTLNGITPSKLATYKGKQETITVSASGGTSLLYQYHIYNYQTQQWSMVQSYSTSSSLKWTFTALGNYQVMCFIKDVTSTKEYDAVAYCEATVNSAPVTLNGITPEQLTTTVGEQETIKVSASGGTTLLYQYNVYDCQKKVWTVAQDYSTNPLLNWTFKTIGNYQVKCYVKDKASSNQYDKVAYCNATVIENAASVTTMNTTSPTELATVKGKLETFTVSDGTSTSLLYQFHIYDYQTKVWTLVQAYGSFSSINWSFDSAGRYQIMCFVKDKSSANQYDKLAYCEVTVGSSTVNGSYTVVLDAGHGGTDSGAIGVTGVYEKTINLPVALKVGAMLEAAGVNVVYTRTTDVTTSLQARCDTANSSGAAYLVSIHCNAVDNVASANGTETLYDTTDPESLKLAAAIQNALVEELGSANRGLKNGDWLYLVGHTDSSCAVALAELGFLTNAEEESLLVTESYQDRCASAIADAIVSCLNN